MSTRPGAYEIPSLYLALHFGRKPPLLKTLLKRVETYINKGVIVTSLLALLCVTGCSAFSAPGTVVEYHNRVTIDYQIEKFSPNPTRGGGVSRPPKTQNVEDNR